MLFQLVDCLNVPIMVGKPYSDIEEGCPIDRRGGEVLFMSCLDLFDSVKFAIVDRTLWAEAERIFRWFWLSLGEVLFESNGLCVFGEVFVFSSLPFWWFWELWLLWGLWKIWLIKCFTAFFFPFFLADPFRWACSFFILSNSSERSRILSSVEIRKEYFWKSILKLWKL